MLARLWWKDMRQFWPIWAVLIATAIGGEWLLLMYGDRSLRTGIFASMAIGLTVLYAVAAGAAAFAGERELGTLDLLDALPVPRRLLWGGKVSFALLSTLGLLLVLLAIAALGTERWKIPEPGLAAIAFGSAAILFEAMAWSLFWSSRVRTALAAALLGLASWGVVTPAIGALLGAFRQGGTAFDADGFVMMGVIRLVVGLLAFAGSAWATTAVPRPTGLSESEPEPARRAWWSRLKLRSPLVVEELTPSRPLVRVRRPFWPEVRALAWQAVREGFRPWLMVLGLGVLAPAVLGLIGGQVDPALLLGFFVLASLAAGVSVFHPETRDDTRRFLAQHGATPRRVWLVRMMIWGTAVLLSYFGLVLGAALVLARGGGPAYAVGPAQAETLFVLMGMAAPAFAVGLVSGMVFRRGITAAMLGLLTLVALAIPIGMLAATRMLPMGALLLVPWPLVAVSWFWKADWMYDRPAPGRWLRLGGLLSLALAITFGAYVAFRVGEVPEATAFPAPQGWTDAVADDANAAPLYRRIKDQMRVAFDPANVRAPQGRAPGAPQSDGVAAFLERNAGLLPAIREAAAKPRCRFANPGRKTVFTQDEALSVLRDPATLLEVDARARLDAGDLDAAWADLIAWFRLGRQMGDDPSLMAMITADAWERQATDLAHRWADAPGQTPKRLLDALADLSGLNPRRSPEQSVLAEGRLVAQALELPADDLRVGLLGITQGGNKSDGVGRQSSAEVELAVLPWERERSRKVLRLLMGDAVDQARREPWARDRLDPISGRYVAGSNHPPGRPGRMLGPLDQMGGSASPPLPWRPHLVDLLTTTPLMRMIFPPIASYLVNDALTEAQSRGLTVYLRLRAWQLAHDGRAPASLSLLNEDGRGDLPIDPFSGGEFGYVVRNADNGQFRHVLYSRAPDLVDNLGAVAYPDRFGRGDLLFPLPPEPPAEKASVKEDGDAKAPE